MLVYLLQVHVLLTTLLSQPMYAQACEEGLFGEACTYRCHCLRSATCDLFSGRCPTGPCSSGYFGPGCQYNDIVYHETSESVPYFLRDSDDSTCNPNPDATSVEMLQELSYPLSFVRIVVENGIEHLLNFTTTLNGAQPCDSEIHFKVDDRTVDVTCDVNINVNRIQIKGSIAGRVCSVLISSGRNVGIKHNTSQSSTNLPYEQSKSSNAVDGSTLRAMLQDSCSSTDPNATSQPEWTLTFNRPHIMYGVTIFNRDAYMERLSGFKLETFDQNGDLVVSYVDKTSAQDTYFVPIQSQTPVITLKITQSLSKRGEDRMLTLCEVVIYGDTFCENNTYGSNCQYPCQCTKTERCHVATGACAQGCQPGFYGYNCLNPCDVACYQCEWITGQCVLCIPGYMGDKCSTECSPGYYGPHCINACPDRCVDICRRIDGACECRPEFTGTLCAECSSGYYGPSCSLVCSDRCASVCNNINGTCLCKKEFIGDNCIGCSPGYFGQNCENMCSGRCLRTCDPVDGKCVCKKEFTGELCTVCSPGYYGPGCSQKCSEGCADICNNITGSCLCKEEFIGVNCAGCSATFYGAGCSSKCSRNCLDRVCDQMSGMCSSCAPGYWGDNCETGTGWAWLFIFPVIPLIVLLAIFVLRNQNQHVEGR